MNSTTTLKADSEMRCELKNEPYFYKYILNLKLAYFRLYSTSHLLRLVTDNNLNLRSSKGLNVLCIKKNTILKIG